MLVIEGLPDFLKGVVGGGQTRLSTSTVISLEKDESMQMVDQKLRRNVPSHKNRAVV